MDDADLSGMSLQEAKEYIWRHATTLKQMEKEIEQVQKDCDLWTSRVLLAESKGMAELLSAAQAEASKYQGKLESLKSEAASLRGLIERQKRNLNGVKAHERSVDADLILAEMDLSLGGDGYGSASETAKANAAFGEMDADANLAALKQQAAASQAEEPDQSAAEKADEEPGQNPSS